MNRKHSNGPLESPWIRMWMSVHAKLWKCGRKTNPWDLTTSKDYHLRTIFCCEAKNVSPCQYEREGKGKEERRHEITSFNVISVGKILSACYQVVGGENVSRSQKDLFGFSFFLPFQIEAVPDSCAPNTSLCDGGKYELDFNLIRINSLNW